MNLGRELTKNKVIFLCVESNEYEKAVINTAETVSKGSVAYVTLNKTCFALRDFFKKRKVNVDNFVFVDTISKAFTDKPDQSDAVYYIHTPNSLKELSKVIDRFLRHRFEYLIIDSLNDLLVYRRESTVRKFISELTKKIKSSDTTAIFYAINTKEHKIITKWCKIFAGKIVRINSVL